MWQRIKQKVYNSVRGTPIPPNDTEGIATFALFDKDENREDVVGCIVRNNNNFIQLINPKHLYVQKYKKIKHFAYYFQSTDFLPQKAVITFENEDSSSIVCEVDNLSTEKKIAMIEGKCHSFVPCESENFNKSKVLQYYSKIVPDIVDELGSSKIAVENNKFYGLGKDEQRLLTLVFMEVKRCEQAQNLHFVDDRVYDKLIDGPLFLDDKTTLVGWCTKNEENKKIDIHNFKKQDCLGVWKASVTDSLTANTRGETNANIENEDVQACGGGNQDRSSDTKEPQDECEAPALNRTSLTDSCDRSTNSNSSKISNQDKSNLQSLTVKVNEIKPQLSYEGKESFDSDDCIAVGNKDRRGGYNDDSEGNGRDTIVSLVVVPQSQEPGPYSVDNHENPQPQSQESGPPSIDSHENPQSQSQESGPPSIDSHENQAQPQSQESEPSSNAIQQNFSTKKTPTERSESVIATDNQSISNDHLSTEERGHPGAVVVAVSVKTTPEQGQTLTLCDLCRKDSTVIQDVSHRFDDKTKKNLRNVLVLAERVEAHPVIKNKCASNYSHSPSLELIKMPHVSMLSVQDFADSLRSIGREDVAKMIDGKVPGNSSKNENDMLKQVEVVLLKPNMHEFLEDITAELDKCGHGNWRSLGKKLHVEEHVLDHIESGTNSAERFLVDCAYGYVPSSELRLNSFYEHMASLGREDEISVLYGKYKIQKNDPKSMKTVFKPNSQAMEDLSHLLNVKGHRKGWQHLAARWEVPPEIYFHFIPDTTVSPTRILLEWLMMAKPEFTVDSMMKHLRAINRNDVCEVFEEKLSAVQKQKPN